MVFTTAGDGPSAVHGSCPFFDIGLGAWSQLFVIDAVENLDTLGLPKYVTVSGSLFWRP